MGYRYIGAKTKISDEILNEISRISKKTGKNTVSDLMCGTGSVSLRLRKEGYRVISSDVMLQACLLTKAKLLLQDAPNFENARSHYLRDSHPSLLAESAYQQVLNKLNSIKGKKGYFYREFSPAGQPQNGAEPRKYFSPENAKKIDAIRDLIRSMRESNSISDIEHALLIRDLILAANDIANIAGTYGHYLSKFVSRAEQPIKLTQTTFEVGGKKTGHTVLHGHAEDIARNIKADICYIDPPYIKRQYAANYHVLETIAKEDAPVAAGQSGLRPWRDEYSDFCSKVNIRKAFSKIFTEMKCDHFLISYSSEGLLSKEDLTSFLKTHGKVTLKEFEHKRFKSRNESAQPNITEYLFHLAMG